MTDNAQELDEILDFIENYGVSASCDGFDPHKSRNEAKRAIHDWHNKQVEAELEALREEVKHEDLRTISQIITARIDKLKESK